jgi:hypothetical protein
VVWHYYVDTRVQYLALLAGVAPPGPPPFFVIPGGARGGSCTVADTRVGSCSGRTLAILVHLLEKQ